MAGGACLATVFKAQLSEAKRRGLEVPVSRLVFMTGAAKEDPKFPALLGRAFFEQEKFAEAVDALKEARQRVLRQMTTSPGDPGLLEELSKLEDEIAEAEAAYV